MTIQQQDAIWPIVRMIWATGLQKTMSRRLVRVLQIGGVHPEMKVHRYGLDRIQSREAFFARLAQMKGGPRSSRKLSQFADASTTARGSAQPKSGAAGRLEREK